MVVSGVAEGERSATPDTMLVNSVDAHGCDDRVDLERDAVAEMHERFAVLLIECAARPQDNEIVDVALFELVESRIQRLDDHMVVFALVHSEHEATGCVIVGHGCNDQR